MYRRLDHAAKPECKTMKTVLKITALSLTLASLSAAHSEELGRLFFTPEQRTQLNDGKFQEGDSGSDSRSLTVNGIVQQHGGNRTAWINGVPRSAGKSDEHNPASLPVTIPNHAQPVTVKVGQKININSTDTGKH
jgi:hypothetical protein